MSSYLFLDTNHSYLPTTPHCGRWSLALENLTESFNASISLVAATIPHSRPPVHRFNNVLQLEEKDDNSSTLVTLPIRDYTATELASQLKTSLDSATQESNVFTVTFSNSTQQFTISASATNFKFGEASTALKVLGILPSQQVYATSVTSGGVVRLDGTAYIDVISNFSTVNVSTSSQTAILARIPSTVSFGSLQLYQPSIDMSVHFRNTEIDTITMEIIDDEGNPYEVPEYSNISYTLKLDQ